MQQTKSDGSHTDGVMPRFKRLVILAFTAVTVLLYTLPQMMPNSDSCDGSAFVAVLADNILRSIRYGLPPATAFADVNSSVGESPAGTNDIQTAIYNLPAAGGDVYLKPNTTYSLKSTIIVDKPNVRIIGAEKTSVLRRETSFSRSNMISVSGDNFKLVNTTLDSSDASTNSSDLKIAGNFCAVEDCRFLNFNYIAITLCKSSGGHVKGTRIERCYFTSPRSANINNNAIWSSNEGADGLIIKNNVFEDINICAVFVDGNDIMIAGNRVKNCHRQTYPTGGGTIATAYYGARNVSITGNVIEGTTVNWASSGIEINGEYVSAIGNIIINPGWTGITIQSGSHHTVDRNIISNAGTNTTDKCRAAIEVPGYLGTSIKFVKGFQEILPGDLIGQKGGVGNGEGRVRRVQVDKGSWARGDAEGMVHMVSDTVRGAFVAGEVLRVGRIKKAQCGSEAQSYEDPVTDFVISNNACFDDRTTKYQKYGVWVIGKMNNRFKVIDNNLYDNLITAIKDESIGKDKVIAGNQSFRARRQQSKHEAHI